MTATDAYDGIGPWRCTECGHSHTGRQLGYICIGCACDFVPDHPTVDAFLAPVRASTSRAVRDVAEVIDAQWRRNNPADVCDPHGIPRPGAS